MESTQIVLDLFEKLTGQDRPLDRTVPRKALERLEGDGLGYSQFNELLLTLGYDRVTHAFFQYLVNGETDYQSGAAFKSVTDLNLGVDRFRKLGMMLYGNVKYAFKRLSSDQQDLVDQLRFLECVPEQSFKDRHHPIHPIESIPGEKAFYLGYIVEAELKKRLEANPSDSLAQEEEKVRKATVATGKKNHEAYLVSDHLDVYIATSMRERHEYQTVNRLTKEIFSHRTLADLRLRYFDPTQAYCHNRIDKGLAEGLMLKRAKCTIYFAQESDTLGKDSELASTLAQGKPVIAYVPDPPSNFASSLIQELSSDYPNKSERELILEQLRLFAPAAAWTDPQVRDWLYQAATFDTELAISRLQSAIKAHYDKRSKILREDHPLGIQVNLSTGVANGVLVVRSVEQCAALVRRIVLHDLEFEIDDKVENEMKYSYLREKISGCVFRVVTGDRMLTNTFWNFYLLSPIESQ